MEIDTVPSGYCHKILQSSDISHMSRCHELLGDLGMELCAVSLTIITCVWDSYFKARKEVAFELCCHIVLHTGYNKCTNLEWITLLWLQVF